MHNGNLVLLTLDGKTPFRQLRKEGRLWWADPVDGKSSEPMLLAYYGVQGVVIGVVRLFNELRPQESVRVDANYDAGFETPSSRSEERLSELRKQGYPKTGWSRPGVEGKKTALLPTARNKTVFWLNDIDPKIHYEGRRNKR